MKRDRLEHIKIIVVQFNKRESFKMWITSATYKLNHLFSSRYFRFYSKLLKQNHVFIELYNQRSQKYKYKTQELIIIIIIDETTYWRSESLYTSRHAFNDRLATRRDLWIIGPNVFNGLLQLEESFRISRAHFLL